MHNNALNNVWFGVDHKGTLGACPHAFLHGLIPYVVEIVIGSFY